MFCNVVGREEGSSGVETDNDAHSKCNKQEAEKVVSIDHNMLCYDGFHSTCLMTTLHTLMSVVLPPTLPRRSNP